MVVETEVHTYIIKIAHKLNTTQVSKTEVSVTHTFLKITWACLRTLKQRCQAHFKKFLKTHKNTF